MSFTKIILIVLLLIIIIFALWIWKYCLNESFTDLKTQISNDIMNKNPIQDYTVNPILTDISGNPLKLTVQETAPTNKRYDPDNYNVTYHEMNPDGEYYDTNFAGVSVLDKSNNLVVLPYAKSQNLPVYYDVEKYPKGPPRPVPNYRETVLLNTAQSAIWRI